MIPCDTVLLSVGQAPALKFLEDGGADIEMMRPGWPKVDPQRLNTTAEGVFVAGDVRHGSVKRVASSVGEGSIAVQFIHQYLSKL